jgi:hypothetical protein
MMPLASSYPLLGVLATRFEGTIRPIGGAVLGGFSLSAAAAVAAAVSAELASPDGGWI